MIITISDSAKCLDAIHFGDLLMHDTDYFYRPQRSCSQSNIFAPVCHSVHRVGVCLSACWDTNPWSRHPPRSRPLPREQYFSCEWMRWCPGPGLGGVQAHAQGGMSRPRGEVSRDRLGCVQSQARGVQAQAGVCPGTGLAHEMVVCHFLGDWISTLLILLITAAVGTHPIRMHSCMYKYLIHFFTHCFTKINCRI